MDLAGQRIAYFGFTGPIESNGVTRIATAFNSAVNEAYDEVHLCFSSNGGYVADGIYLHNHIRGLPINIVCHNMGNVSSIAVAVFVAADERYCSTNSMFLIHPTGMPSREGLTAEHLQSSLDSALTDDERTERILRERTRLPDDLLNARRSKTFTSHLKWRSIMVSCMGYESSRSHKGIRCFRFEDGFCIGTASMSDAVGRGQVLFK